MQQLSLFDDSQVLDETEIQLNDKVKIILIAESEDSEIHNYRKYYYAHVIGKIGIVTEIRKGKNGHSFDVSILGENVTFAENELIWID
ncbi:MAG: hypothetical protein RR651_15630 [Lysinibacillus sp.]